MGDSGREDGVGRGGASDCGGGGAGETALAFWGALEGGAEDAGGLLLRGRFRRGSGDGDDAGFESGGGCGCGEAGGGGGDGTAAGGALDGLRRGRIVLAQGLARVWGGGGGLVHGGFAGGLFGGAGGGDADGDGVAAAAIAFLDDVGFEAEGADDAVEFEEEAARVAEGVAFGVAPP